MSATSEAKDEIIRVLVGALKELAESLATMECRSDEDCDHCFMLHHLLEPALYEAEAIANSTHHHSLEKIEWGNPPEGA